MWHSSNLDQKLSCALTDTAASLSGVIAQCHQHVNAQCSNMHAPTVHPMSVSTSYLDDGLAQYDVRGWQVLHDYQCILCIKMVHGRDMLRAQAVLLTQCICLISHTILQPADQSCERQQVVSEVGCNTSCVFCIERT